MLEVEIVKFYQIKRQKVRIEIKCVLFIGIVHVFSIVPSIAFGHDEIDQFVDSVFACAIGSGADVGFFDGDRHLDAELTLHVLNQVGDVDSSVFDAA